MVNTATKLIWTSYRDDAAKFAGSMQVKPEDILNLPQFTFGMYLRKRGFAPIRGDKDALGHFPKREDQADFKSEMEEKYGPSEKEEQEEKTAEKKEDLDEGAKNQEANKDDEDLGEPPEVETI